MTIDLLHMSRIQILAEQKRRDELRARNLPLSQSPTTDDRDLAIVVRSADGCRIILGGAPRTKKNSTTLGIKQSPAYRKFCADVVYQLRRFGEMLPDSPYNLEAHFYVDGYGRQADLIGLLQGLADALQAARVVSDDKWFLGFDGSRKHVSDTAKPRVEITITPLSNA